MGMSMFGNGMVAFAISSFFTAIGYTILYSADHTVWGYVGSILCVFSVLSIDVTAGFTMARYFAEKPTYF